MLCPDPTPPAMPTPKTRLIICYPPDGTRLRLQSRRLMPRCTVIPFARLPRKAALRRRWWIVVRWRLMLILGLFPEMTEGDVCRREPSKHNESGECLKNILVSTSRAEQGPHTMAFQLIGSTKELKISANVCAETRARPIFVASLFMHASHPSHNFSKAGARVARSHMLVFH